MAKMPLDGINVLSLESRRANEMAELIRRQGGTPIVAPSMREVPLEENREAFEFAARLFAGEFDLVILLTGVGTRLLNRILATRYPEERFAEALRRTTVIVRGPKPAAALRELNVPIAAIAPEPNTWREVLAITEGRNEKHVALQEYGKSNLELVNALTARGASVTAVRVYGWDLPLDTAPLRAAVRRLAAGEIGMAMFTTSIQVEHLLRIAAEEGVEDSARQGLRHAIVASIGPTTSEALEEAGIHVDFEPSHPKMGVMVLEAARQAATLKK